jgi:hypothetical protein
MSTAVAAAACLIASACAPELTSVGAWDGADAGDAGRRPEPAPPPPAGPYLEAEDGQLTGGFAIASDPEASSEKYLTPPPGPPSEDEPGPARARYRLQVPSEGEYVLWGRIRAPGADDNRFWFQVDDGSWYKWRISVGEIWFWDDLHDDDAYDQPLTFEWREGVHELEIASCVEGASLDRLYFTSGGDQPPGNDTPCDPPHSIEIDGECLPSCGRLQGTRCGPLDCEGRALLAAYDCDICCRIDPQD